MIYDAGLGAGPDGFLAMSIRRLPGSRPALEIWPAARAPRRVWAAHTLRWRRKAGTAAG